MSIHKFWILELKSCTYEGTTVYHCILNVLGYKDVCPGDEIFLTNAKADPFSSTKNGKPSFRKRRMTCLPIKTLSVFLQERYPADISPAKENFYLDLNMTLFACTPSTGLILRRLLHM